MIFVTQRMIKKIMSNGLNSQAYRVNIIRQTWWLFRIIPLFSKETIISHTMG